MPENNTGYTSWHMSVSPHRTLHESHIATRASLCNTHLNDYGQIPPTLYFSVKQNAFHLVSWNTRKSTVHLQLNNSTFLDRIELMVCYDEYGTFIKNYLHYTDVVLTSRLVLHGGAITIKCINRYIIYYEILIEYQIPNL